MSVAGALRDARVFTLAEDGLEILDSVETVGIAYGDGRDADPFDVGSGHIDANRADDPRLVYASDRRDYAAYLCGLVKPPFLESECAALAAAGYPSEPQNVNEPSIAVAQLITGDTVRRRVTNIGPPGSFSARVSAPPRAFRV